MKKQPLWLLNQSARIPMGGIGPINKKSGVHNFPHGITKQIKSQEEDALGGVFVSPTNLSGG